MIYTPSAKLREQIENDFRYHAPHGDQPQRYERIRQQARNLAEVLATNCPGSRELDHALDSLKSAVMWANASIAINERPQEMVRAILNGKPVELPKVLTYESIIHAAGFLTGRVLTVTFLRGAGKESGSICPGESMMLTPGIVISVADTGSA